jgi:hypothetical protein
MRILHLVLDFLDYIIEKPDAQYIVTYISFRFYANNMYHKHLIAYFFKTQLNACKCAYNFQVKGKVVPVWESRCVDPHFS